MGVIFLISFVFLCKTLNGAMCIIIMVINEMGRIDVVLPDNLEKQLREAVFKRKGMKRGNLKQAINEAIILWIERGEKG